MYGIPYCGALQELMRDSNPLDSRSEELLGLRRCPIGGLGADVNAEAARARMLQVFSMDFLSTDASRVVLCSHTDR